MYTIKHEHNQKIDGFTEGSNIPQLNVEEQESLEKDLTLKELKDGLASFGLDQLFRNIKRSSARVSS